MKKILSLLGAMGVVVSASPVAISCSNKPLEKKQATELSYIEGKKDSDFISLLKSNSKLHLSNGGGDDTYRKFKLSADEKSLADDYGDTKNKLFEFGLGESFSLEGTAMTDFDEHAPLFEQTKNLKEINYDENHETFDELNTFTIKGNKGDTEFKLNYFFIKVKHNKEKETLELISVENLYFKIIKIS